MYHDQSTGKIQNNPLYFLVSGNPSNPTSDSRALILCKQAAHLYCLGRTKEALQCLLEASNVSSNIYGIYFAQAVCLAQLGKFEDAINLLNYEFGRSISHPKSKVLRSDIYNWIQYHEPEKLVGNPELSPITVFSTTKPFEGKTSIAQKNAILSWKNLTPMPEIILLGNSSGLGGVCKELGIHHIPDVKCNEFGTPLISSLFSEAQTLAHYDVMMYVNSDIILMDDIMAAVSRIRKEFDHFLIIGRRWDVDFHRSIDFTDKEWSHKVREIAHSEGRLHEVTGIDYFIFSKNLWGTIPDFTVGRAAWDIGMVYRALASQYPVIDVTEVVKVVHQNHDYKHIIGGQTTAWQGIEAQRNHDLAGAAFPKGMKSGGIGYISDATWELTRQELRRKLPRFSVPPSENKGEIKQLFKAIQRDPFSQKNYVDLGDALKTNGKHSEAQRSYSVAKTLSHLST